MASVPLHILGWMTQRVVPLTLLYQCSRHVKQCASLKTLSFRAGRIRCEREQMASHRPCISDSRAPPPSGHPQKRAACSESSYRTFAQGTSLGVTIVLWVFSLETHLDPRAGRGDGALAGAFWVAASFLSFFPHSVSGTPMKSGRRGLSNPAFIFLSPSQQSLANVVVTSCG
jgi:hypothetical protein